MFSNPTKFLSPVPHLLVFSMLLLSLTAGCRVNQEPPPVQSAAQPVTSPVVQPVTEPAPAPVVATPPAVQPAVGATTPAAVVPAARVAVRIKAGNTQPYTDSKGNVWLPDQGFDGGDTIERADLVITNTTEPDIYRSEHYSMNSFSWPLANGNYQVKLHFCETFDGITAIGQRVFSFSVQGHEFKDFDIWAKAGGPLTAHIETVPVEIKDGKLLITFTSNVENPEINGIEILPQP